ncbi:restriction endonuclease subunit S [Ezakiella peruensis]|uniref:restriction endonuclease subunit S n=1 Tax=Ezakiella peruensis TaxID=1464038 RepID=UPI000C1B36A5|nr:restriction endonuclease subunit S [Ezakiella peruensis]
MNNILEMIKNEKVEWKKLGDVARCFAGGTPKTNIRSYYDGDIPWIRSGEINFNVIRSSERNITKEGLDKSSAKMIRPNSVVLAMTGATVGRSAVVEFATASNQSVAAIENNEELLNYKFLYYYISNNYENIKNMGQGALTSLNLGIIKNFQIPIPSLETQERIVKILDTMVDHFTQLQAELQARNRQYEHYRDKLLSEEYLNKLSEKFGGKVEWKNLGDIGKISMCKRILKNQTSNIGEVPFYKIGTFGKTPDSFISKELFLEYKDKFSYPREGNILFSASGTIGRTVIFDGKDSYYQDSNIVWIDNDESQALDKYLYYFYQIVKWPVSKGGTISRIYNRDINKIKILVPPIAVQEYIVSILDNFNKIVSDINEGLPKEIELRQKQYEYYRERLLDFKREED